MNDIFGLIATVIFGLGTAIIWGFGDASHVSYKTLQLMFVYLLLQVPAIGLEGFNVIMDISRYVGNIVVILAVIRQFTTVGCSAHATYSRTLDSFPLHWMLVLLATVVPMLLVFVPQNGTMNAGICTPAVFQYSPWGCSYNFLWNIDFCLMPLMFLPQLIVCYKLSRENTPTQDERQTLSSLYDCLCGSGTDHVFVLRSNLGSYYPGMQLSTFSARATFLWLELGMQPILPQKGPG